MIGIDNRAARYAWTVALIALLLAILYRIFDTLFIFIVALLFAYLLWPLVNYLDRRLPGRSRAPALAIVYIVFMGLLFFGIFEIGSRVVVEAQALLTQFPKLLAKIQQAKAPPSLQSVQSVRDMILLELQRQLAEHSREIFSFIPTAAVKVISAARNLVFIILVPILSFFFLKDGYFMWGSFLELIPEGVRRKQLQEIGRDLHVLLAQYMRALIILAALTFTAYGVFFSLIRAPYAILLAAIDFPLEMIPMVGPFVGFVIIILVAGFSGFHHLLWIVVFMAIFRLFQDYVIAPHIMSAEMKLHPLVIIFGVLAGAELTGIIGSFLSVPTLAVLRIVYLHLRKRKLVILQDSSGPIP